MGNTVKLFKRFSLFSFFAILYPLSAMAEPLSPEKQEALLAKSEAQLRKVIQVNYLPYSPSMTVALRKADQSPFLSALLPVMLERGMDGSWKLLNSSDANAWQGSMEHDPVGGCPWQGNTLERDVAYKPNIEIFISRSSSRNTGSITLEADGQILEGKLENGCARFCTPGSPARLKGNIPPKELKIIGLRPNVVTIPLNIDYRPFILLRYKSGEMLPVPARLDTVVYDDDRNRLYLGYRATALRHGPIRKIEYRMTSPSGSPESIKRSLAMNRYLDSCPTHDIDWPGEACADPDQVVNYKDLIIGLGMDSVGNSAGSPSDSPSDAGKITQKAKLQKSSK